MLFNMFAKKSVCTGALLYAVVTVVITFLFGCQGESKVPQDPNISKLTGVWLLTARVIDGREQPADQRILKLIFTDKGAFSTEFRGEKDQQWIRPGGGVFTFSPPLLTLYWDSGSVTTLALQELAKDRLLLHHGRNFVPLRDQEPDEIYQRQAMANAPKRYTN